MSSSGSSDRLPEDPFLYRVTKGGRILIDRGGAPSPWWPAGRLSHWPPYSGVPTPGVQKLLARATEATTASAALDLGTSDSSWSTGQYECEPLGLPGCVRCS